MDAGQDELKARLVERLGADYVLTGDATARYAVQDRVPQVVARPADAEGVSSVLMAAAESGAKVVPWGGGTAMSLGYPPRSVDVVLVLDRLNRIIAHDPADLTATVEAGCTLAQVAQVLTDAGQMLPLDAPMPARATIGGLLATGMAGPRRLLYGGPRDLLLGVRAVDAMGTITKAGGRVVKNVTGYDLNKLYLGSLGTLAVLVEASFKLVPRPESEATALAVCQDTAQALAIADAWNNMPAQPAAVCALTLTAVPQLAARTSQAGQNIGVAARFPGPATAVQRAVEDARAAAHKAGAGQAERLEEAEHATFWDEVTDFPATFAMAPDSALIKVNVLPSEVGNTLQTALSAAAEHGLSTTWMADAGVGVVYLRVRPAGGVADGRHIEALRPGLVALQTMLAQRWRNAVVLGCPPEIKADLPLWGAEPPAIEVMRIIKHRFDPTNTLNPGRFVAGL